jgi:transcriptional regulator
MTDKNVCPTRRLTGLARRGNTKESNVSNSLVIGLMDTELLKGTLSLLILSLLSRKEMYGYEIAATVHNDTNGAFTWREGSMYPSLHKMEQSGLIVGKWEERDTGRKRRYYHITRKGRQSLAEKIESWGELCQAVNAILEKSDGQA